MAWIHAVIYHTSAAFPESRVPDITDLPSPFQPPKPAHVSPTMPRLKALELFPFISKIIRPRVGVKESPRINTTVTEPPLELQKSSQLVELPDELLFTIANHLSLTDRARLLQTCRYLHSLLEVTQYRHIDTLYQRPSIYSRSDRLHRTLSERPELISCIVSYCGPLIPNGIDWSRKKKIKLYFQNISTLRRPWDDLPVTETESFRRAIYIFTNASNIRELQFTNCDDWAFNPIWEPIRTSISKMPLTRLVLFISFESAKAVPLLRALPGLESLELYASEGGKLEGLEEGDIPNLKLLRATLADAAAIVPGRPVVEFDHVPGSGELPLDEQLVQKLSLSTSPITKFTTHLRNPWPPRSVRTTLQVLARHLPELQHLTITVSGHILGQILLDEIPSFRHLRSVKFLDVASLLSPHAWFLSPSDDVSLDFENDTGGGIARQTPPPRSRLGMSYCRCCEKAVPP